MRHLSRVRFLLTVVAMVAGTTLACGGGGNDNSNGGSIDNCGGTPPAANPNGISGTVCYQFVPATVSAALDFAHAAVKPARNVTVEVLQGTTVLGSATTDENGQYSINYTATGGESLMLAALAKTTTPSIQVEDNTDSNSIWAITANIDSSTHSKELVATHGWTGSSYDASKRAAAPFAILDTMYTASKAFMAVRSTVTFPALKVNWSPNNDSELIGTSHFAPSENEIYILGKEGADTDEFDNHVIAHEWGHFFEKNLSRSDSPGGPHGTGDVLDPRLAFGEGYGNAIAAMVLGDAVYVDTMWNQTALVVGLTMDAETELTPTDDPTPGSFSEMSILRLLYDIFDSGSSESYDQIAVGLGTIYDVLVGPEKNTIALTTIGSFVTGLKAQSGVDSTKVDTLLAHYNIGPITDEWGTGDTLGQQGGLSAMYTPVDSLPVDITQELNAGDRNNLWETNQYYVVTGAGNPVTVEGSSADGYFLLSVYHRGEKLGSTDPGNSGTLSFDATDGEKYVVIVTGATTGSDRYKVYLNFSQ